MSFHRKRKRWAGPGLDPAKSLEIWKARHPHEEVPFNRASKAPALPTHDSEGSAVHFGWLGQSGSTPTSTLPPQSSGVGLTPEADPTSTSALPPTSTTTDSHARLLEQDNPFTNPPRGLVEMPESNAGSDGSVAESADGQSTPRSKPDRVVSRPRSLLLRLVRFTARFIRRPGPRPVNHTPPPEITPPKGLGEQVDEFVELLASGNSLPQEHRDKLVKALRGGLESGQDDASPGGEPPEVQGRVETPTEPVAESAAPTDPVTVQAPLLMDPGSGEQRLQELQAKDRQIEILEVKVRRLAAMLKEQERRNAEALDQAARNRTRFPGVSHLRRKSSPQPREGTSDLMLGIRELNRQIREEIQSLYAGKGNDAKSALNPAEAPEGQAD